MLVRKVINRSYLLHFDAYFMIFDLLERSPIFFSINNQLNRYCSVIISFVCLDLNIQKAKIIFLFYFCVDLNIDLWQNAFNLQTRKKKDSLDSSKSVYKKLKFMSWPYWIDNFCLNLPKLVFGLFAKNVYLNRLKKINK